MISRRSAPQRGPSSTRVDGFDLVAEVESGEAAVEASDSFEPDLVLMDINMGELDGIEATRRIVAAHPDTKVILVSTYGRRRAALRRPHQRRHGVREQGRAVAPGRASHLGGRRRPRLGPPRLTPVSCLWH